MKKLVGTTATREPVGNDPRARAMKGATPPGGSAACGEAQAKFVIFLEGSAIITSEGDISPEEAHGE